MDTKFYQEVFSKHRVNTNVLLYREVSVPQLRILKRPVLTRELLT